MAVGFYHYDTSVGGNAALLAAFVLLVPAALFMGYRFATPLFSATLTTGILLEALGFIGRLLLHSTPDSRGNFTLALVGSILGPTFMSAAIFLILPHVLRVYGDHLCPFRPLFVAVAFCSLIFIALVVEIVGIVFTVYEFNGVTSTEGLDIIAGGLSLQTILLICSTGVHFCFTMGLSTRRGSLDPKHHTVYASTKFKKFLMGMELATVLLVASSIYRIIESVNGIDGKLFQNQIAFMIMSGVLPLLSCALLIIFHPGDAFGPSWRSTSPRKFQRRNPPRPLHPTHHRYDPFIRSETTPTSQKHVRSPSNPPELPTGSPGLPHNPRPTATATSPRTSPRSATHPHAHPRPSPISAGYPSPGAAAAAAAAASTHPSPRSAGYPSPRSAVYPSAKPSPILEMYPSVKQSPNPDRRSSGPADRKSAAPTNLVDRDTLW